jgi:hypothetical protein
MMMKAIDMRKCQDETSVIMMKNQLDESSGHGEETAL